MSNRDLVPVRVGIVGQGRSGWGIHAALLKELPEHYQVVAVSDPLADRCKEAVATFGCAAYLTIEELLADPAIELVVVAPPTFLHTPNTIQALEAGKAVVCEKPMAANLSDADRMIETARRTGSLLTVFQNRRYDPDMVKVRQVIESGVLGRIVQIKLLNQGFGRRWDWQTLKSLGGGSLRNNGIHAIDQALQFIGPAEPEVFCHLDRTLTLGDADDHVKIVLKAPGAPTVDIEVTSCCAYPQDYWHVYGTQGGLTGTARALRWKYFLPEELPPRSATVEPTPDRSYNSEPIRWHEESWTLEGDTSSGWKDYYLDLYKTLRHGAPLAVTPESVRRDMAVIEECCRICPL